MEELSTAHINEETTTWLDNQIEATKKQDGPHHLW